MEYSRRSKEFATDFQNVEIEDVDNELLEADGIQRLEPATKLMQDVVTRWSSTYLMLDSVVKQKHRLITALNSHKPDLIPTPNDWEVAHSMLFCLSPFFHSIKDLEGQHYPTLSMLAPSLYGIVRALTHDRTDFTWNNQPKEVKELKERLLVAVKDRYAKLSHSAFLASTLDPRFKQGKFIDDLKERDTFVNRLRAAHAEIKEKLSVGKANAPEVLELDTPLSISYIQQNLSVPDPRSEVEEYLIEIDCPLNHCPLRWWSSREIKSPNLARLAKNISVLQHLLLHLKGSFLVWRFKPRNPRIVPSLSILNIKYSSSATCIIWG